MYMKDSKKTNKSMMIVSYKDDMSSI